MFGLDEHVAAWGVGGGFAAVALVAVLLGLRHATDPDHLTAVIVLMAGAGEEGGRRRASSLGLAWGAGHATTLLLLGLPIVLFERYVPEVVQRGGEVLVGLLIIGLAARLLLRLHRSEVHIHAHEHDGGERHEHAHVHELIGDHAHPHAERTARAAYGIGLVHGIGGSAGVGVLLLAGIPGAVQGTVALVLFAALAAASMAIATTGFGAVLARRPTRRPGRLVPALGVGSLAFGVWYVLGAAELLPPVF